MPSPDRMPYPKSPEPPQRGVGNREKCKSWDPNLQIYLQMYLQIFFEEPIQMLTESQVLVELIEIGLSERLWSPPPGPPRLDDLRLK